MKKYHEAESEFKAVLQEFEKDIFDNNIKAYVWRSYERLANLYYEVLAFDTAKDFLDKAQEIIDENFDKNSFEYLDFLKKLSLYYKKFQKNDAALSCLKKVLKEEREMSKGLSESSRNIQIEDPEEEKKKKKEKKEDKKEDNKEEEEMPSTDENVKGDDPKVQEIKTAAPNQADPKTEDEAKQTPSKKGTLYKSHVQNQFELDINVRLGNTFKMIMNVYANMRHFTKAERFEGEARKMYKLAWGDKPMQLEYVSFCNIVGDICIKKGTEEAIKRAMEIYSESSEILQAVGGDESVDFLLSLTDMGDCYMESKEYEKAQSFYTLSQDKLHKLLGAKTIFCHRINSALIELFAAKGEGPQDLPLQKSMENIELATSTYGDSSIYCLPYYLSGISSSIQSQQKQANPAHANMSENILSKMMKVLESTGEVEKGNQFFFLASILLGVVCFSTNQFEQAHLFFSGTLNKQLKYCGEEDHPFLEQTYMHLALLYKTLKNLNAAYQMWLNLLKVHKRCYGEKTHFLASDYKNIGTCELGLNRPDKAIERFLEAELYCKQGIEIEDLTEEEKKDETLLLATIYFSIYLCHTTLEKYEEALIYNNKNMALNIEIYGKDDLNVANNHYLASQLYLKKRMMSDALENIERSNAIIDEKEDKNPLLFCRYRFMKAKLFKLKGEDLTALKLIEESLALGEGKPEL